MATFYHITLDLAHDGVFSPRVPNDRYETEDSTTNRVCVSDSLEGCFNAIPDGILFTDEHHGYFKLFEINTEDLGISHNDMLTPLPLYKEKGVYDALLTGEHWILTEFTVPKEKQFVCNLLWHEDFSRISLSSSQLTKLHASLKDEMPLPTCSKQLFEELFEYANHSLIADLEERIGGKVVNTRDVTDYAMVKSYSSEQQDVWLSVFDNSRFLEKVKPYLKDVSIVKTFGNEVQLSVPPNIDISELLLAHHDYLRTESLVLT